MNSWSFGLVFNQLTQRCHLIAPPEAHHPAERGALEAVTRRVVRSERGPAAMVDGYARPVPDGSNSTSSSVLSFEAKFALRHLTTRRRGGSQTGDASGFDT